MHSIIEVNCSNSKHPATKNRTESRTILPCKSTYLSVTFQRPDSSLQLHGMILNTMNRKRVEVLLIILLLLSEFAYGMLFTGFSTQIVLFIAVSLIASVFYISICVIVRYGTDVLPKSGLLLILLFSLIYRLTAIWIQPVASGDVYRYLWDGKVQAHGFNPYAHPPTDTLLNGLHSAVSPQTMDYPNMRTIYPPFAEWIFALSFGVAGENPIGIKFFLLIAECLSAWLLALLLKALQKPPAYIAMYVLCPLPIMQFMIDAHMDALAFPFVLLFLLLWIKRKPIGSAVSLGFAIITKLLPVIFLPLLMKGESNKNRYILLGGALGMTALAYIPYILWNGSPWESLGAYTSRWYFNGPVFDIILYSVGRNETAHLVVAGIFALWFMFVLTRSLPLIEKLYFVLFGFFLFSATVHPWYVTWLALMLPLAMPWSGVAYVTMINLANIVVIDYKALKIWHLSPWVEGLEYFPVIILFLWEITRMIKAERSKPKGNGL